MLIERQFLAFLIVYDKQVKRAMEILSLEVMVRLHAIRQFALMNEKVLENVCVSATKLPLLVT